ELADEREIEKMDRFELTPINYSRERIVATAGTERCVAWTYFANPAVRREGLKPSRDYLAHLLAGRPFLSAEYVRVLEQLGCADDCRRCDYRHARTRARIRGAVERAVLAVASHGCRDRRRRAAVRAADADVVRTHHLQSRLCGERAARACALVHRV